MQPCVGCRRLQWSVLRQDHIKNEECVCRSRWWLVKSPRCNGRKYKEPHVTCSMGCIKVHVTATYVYVLLPQYISPQHTHTHTHTCMYTHTHRTHACTHTHTQDTCIYAHTYTHTQDTCMYAHTHTHTMSIFELDLQVLPKAAGIVVHDSHGVAECLQERIHLGREKKFKAVLNTRWLHIPFMEGYKNL